MRDKIKWTVVELTDATILIEGAVVEAENLSNIPQVGMHHYQAPLRVVFSKI